MIFFEDERRIAYYMLEGNTITEAAAEFGIKVKKISSILNDRIRFNNPEVYALIKKKPYMAFQRCIYKKCSIRDACKIFQISEKTFNDFLNEILKSDKKMYIKMRNQIYISENSKK